MKFERMLEIVCNMGWEMLTELEYTMRYGSPPFSPFECPECGNREFETYYVIYPEDFNDSEIDEDSELDEVIGIMGECGGEVCYGIISKCLNCGYPDPVVEY